MLFPIKLFSYFIFVINDTLSSYAGTKPEINTTDWISILFYEER